MSSDQPVKQPFEAVVAQHGATVLRVVRAVVGPADADDAWSDTFLAALKAYPQLPTDANVEAWLVRIAHRKAIDITRAASRRAVPLAATPDSPAPKHTDGLGLDDLDLNAAVICAAAQTAAGRRLSLPGGPALRRDRGDPRQQRRRRTARGRRRNRHPETHF